MADFDVTVNRHTIQIDISSWNGSEAVLYDGEVVSKKRSFMYLTPYSFHISENEESVVYEVNVITGMAPHGYIVRRNGLL